MFLFLLTSYQIAHQAKKVPRVFYTPLIPINFPIDLVVKAPEGYHCRRMGVFYKTKRYIDSEPENQHVMALMKYTGVPIKI